MKKLIFGVLFLASVGITFIACNKEQIIEQNSTGIVESNNVHLKAKGVVYANLSCTLPNGETGCQCTITESDDDCELQTPCTAQSALPNYSDALEQMFTSHEIQSRARNNVRITEPDLIDALKKDGFPLK